MPERARIVSAMLRMAHQIVICDAFARDAAVCAAATHSAGNHDAAASLRSMVIARKAEIVQMRRTMMRLTTALADMPIEAD